MKNKFSLDKQNAKLMGVCGGIANWAEIDVSMVRLLWVLAALFGVGSPILIYLIIGLVAD